MHRLAALLLAIFALVGLVSALPAPASAQSWNFGTVANISDTLGVNDGRVCIGEGSRKDIGCPTYAPFVNAAGKVGIGTTDPRMGLQVGQFSIEGIGPFPSTGQNVYYDSVNSRWARTGSGFAALQQFQPQLGRYWFYTSSASDVSSTAANLVARLYLSEDGNLGIGTTGPSSRLTVSGEIQTASSGAACTGSLAGAIRYTGGNLSYCNGSAWTLIAGASGGTPGGVSGSIQFNGGGAFAGRSDLVVDNAGRVGIGISMPIVKLDISSTDSAGSQIRLTNGGGISGGQSGLLVYQFQLPNAADQRLGYLIFGSNAGGTGRNTAAVDAFSEGAWTDGASYPTSLRFSTNPAGSISRTERMRITAAGNIGISTTNPNAALEVAGRVSATVMQLGNDGGACNASTVGTLRLNPVNDKLELCRRLN